MEDHKVEVLPPRLLCSLCMVLPTWPAIPCLVLLQRCNLVCASQCCRCEPSESLRRVQGHLETDRLSLARLQD